MAEAIGSVRATFTASADGMIGAINQTVAGLDRLSAATAGANVASKGYAEQIQKVDSAVKGSVAAGDTLGKTVSKNSAAYRDAAKITAELKTPAEKYADTVAKLDRYLAQGLVTQEIYNRATAKAAEEFNGATSSIGGWTQAVQTLEAVVNRTAAAIRGVGDAASSIANAGSEIISFGVKLGATIQAYSVWSALTEKRLGGKSVIDLVLGLGKVITLIKVAEVGFTALGMEVDGVAEFATKATLAFGAFKVAVAAGLTPEKIGTFATSLNNTYRITQTLTTVMARFGVSAGTTAAALSGMGAAGSALGSVLVRVAGMSIPGFGQLAAAIYFGAKAMISAKDTAYEMARSVAELNTEARSLGVTLQDLQVQKALDAGTARDDIIRLGKSLTALDAKHLDNLAFAMERVEAQGTRLSGATTAMANAFAMPFTGAFAAINDGWASVLDGATNLVSGITSIVEPILAALRPFVTLLGTIAEAILRTAGLLASVLGTALRGIGVLVNVVLSPIIVGFNNFADAIRSGVGSAFDWMAERIEWLNQKFDAMYNWLSKLPVIGAAFKSSEGGIPPQAAMPSPAAAGEAAKAAVTESSKADEEDAKAVASAIREQETALSGAIDKAQQYGQAGFDAAVQYQNELRRLEAQLEAGILNETSFGDAARKAKADFDSQIKSLEERNKAAEGITTAIEESTKAGKELGAAAGPIREQFRQTAEEIKRALEAKLITPEDAKKQMEAASEAMNEGFKKAGEQKKSIEDIDKAIKDSTKAGKELGAAADGIRNQFVNAANEIKDKVSRGLISPEDARDQMAAATDAMNEELKRLGEDINFAEKIRDELKTAGEKVQEELAKIEANQTLTADEKSRAKDKVLEKARDALPGGEQDDPVKRFRKAQQELQDAFRNNVIGQEELLEREARIREELDSSLSDLRDKQETNAQPDRRAVSASNVNSSEGASTFFRLLRGSDDPTKRQLDEMKRQTRLLERVNAALGEQQVVRL